MTTAEARRATAVDLWERAARETQRFLFVAAYMLVIFGSFAMYRRLVLHEVGVKYLHYGASVIAALVVAKVVLIGDALGVGERHRQRALVVPVLYKALLYSALVIAFVALERMVEGLVHGDSIGAALVRLTVGRRDELLANTVMVFVAFIPFFALLEVDRVFGKGTLFDMFFRRTRA